jgi:hypothetical protein
MPIKFSDIEMAYEFANFGSPEEHSAYLCKETGEIFYYSEYGEADEEMPDDLEDEKYIELPSKRDLRLGKELVLDFIAEQLPDELHVVSAMFQRRGAYARFKGLLEDRGVLQQWYEYEGRAQAAALRQWCEDNGIEVSG